MPVSEARKLTEWFDKYENEANHLQWPSWLPKLNSTEQFGDSITIKTPNLFEEWFTVPETCRLYASAH